MNSYSPNLLQAFEAREVDPSTFGHADHVRVAYDMLNKYGFMDAALKYGENIDAIATKAGAAGKFNTTITFAFMSLIAERMALDKPVDQAADQAGDYDDFIFRNQDLLSKDMLGKLYSPGRLQSNTACKIFLMPDLPG